MSATRTPDDLRVLAHSPTARVDDDQSALNLSTDVHTLRDILGKESVETLCDMVAKEHLARLEERRKRVALEEELVFLKKQRLAALPSPRPAVKVMLEGTMTKHETQRRTASRCHLYQELAKCKTELNLEKRAVMEASVEQRIVEATTVMTNMIRGMNVVLKLAVVNREIAPRCSSEWVLEENLTFQCILRSAESMEQLPAAYMMSAQGASGLTFTVTDKPTFDIIVNVYALSSRSLMIGGTSTNGPIGKLLIEVRCTTSGYEHLLWRSEPFRCVARRDKNRAN